MQQGLSTLCARRISEIVGDVPFFVSSSSSLYFISNPCPKAKQISVSSSQRVLFTWVFSMYITQELVFFNAE